MNRRGETATRRRGDGATARVQHHLKARKEDIFDRLLIECRAGRQLAHSPPLASTLLRAKNPPCLTRQST